MRTISLLLVGLAGAAMAEPMNGAPPPSEFVYCTTCHGVQMMGNATLNAPRLSGLDAGYVERQLVAYRAGWRGTVAGDSVGALMRPMAMSLSEAQVAAAAEYVASTRSPLPVPTGNGDAERGRSLYPSCAACHGVAGKGNAAVAGPALVGLNDWYLVRQLTGYRDGWRGTHADDTAGQQMVGAASQLKTDDDIADVVAYIMTFSAISKP
ncbi:MAG: c-type cytochrome [Pseudomonadota bacterium]